MSSDRILVRGLRVLAFCGVLEEEKQRRQPFEIDLEVETDMAAAAQSDDLDDTIDYGALVDRLVEVAASARFDLLEAFAARLADAVLSDDRATGVIVEVRKLRPPVAHDLDASGVRIRRER